jgi:hypothetical protein
MNSIVRVGDGDGLYGEQWNLSGEMNFEIVQLPNFKKMHVKLVHFLYYRTSETNWRVDFFLRSRT